LDAPSASGGTSESAEAESPPVGNQRSTVSAGHFLRNAIAVFLWSGTLEQEYQQVFVDDFPLTGHCDWFLDAVIGAPYRLVSQHIGRLCLGCLKLGFVLRVFQPVVVRAAVNTGRLFAFGDLTGYRISL